MRETITAEVGVRLMISYFFTFSLFEAKKKNLDKGDADDHLVSQPLGPLGIAKSKPLNQDASRLSLIAPFSEKESVIKTENPHSTPGLAPITGGPAEPLLEYLTIQALTFRAAEGNCSSHRGRKQSSR